MKLRVLDALLVLLLLPGGFLAWSSGRERSRLTHHYERLKHAVGDLPIGDPGLVHVLALPTGEPGHFAWRFYFPANAQKILRGRYSGSTSWGGGSAEEFIARVRFRQNDDGVMQVYSHFGSGSTVGGFGDKALAGFMRDHWNDFEVEQLGVSGIVSVKPHKPAVLLRLTVPEKLQAEARRRLTPDMQTQRLPVLFELQIGPEPASSDHSLEPELKPEPAAK